MKYVWSCATDAVLLPFFSEHFSRNHLDVGVATGYFPATALAQPWRRDAQQHLSLVDINPSSLAASRARVLAVTTCTEVKCFEADVTAPLPKALVAKSRRFDTISMMNLFHCVPGGPEKLHAFRTYKELLAEGGVLMGCTILGEDHATGWFSRIICVGITGWGSSNSLHDRQEDFVKVLQLEFEEVETWLIGMMLLFRARKPRASAGENSRI